MLKQKVESQGREIRKLKRELHDRVLLPDPQNEREANLMLSESQMKREDLVSMQRNFKLMSKKIEKYDQTCRRRQFLETADFAGSTLSKKGSSSLNTRDNKSKRVSIQKQSTMRTNLKEHSTSMMKLSSGRKNGQSNHYRSKQQLLLSSSRSRKNTLY